MLAARCGVFGWDVSRGTLAKIEAGIRCVSDSETANFALVLKTPIEELYPSGIASVLNRLRTACAKKPPR